MGEIRCPHCGFIASEDSFKLVREPWRFRFYQVKMLECQYCHGIFNYYTGVSPRGRRSEFTIKVKPRVRVAGVARV